MNGQLELPSWNLAALAASSKSVPAVSLPRRLKLRKIRPRTLRNRVPGPPKSSPEPSKTVFLKDIILRRLLEGQGLQVWGLFGPTWLHCGGPKPSKIHPKTCKMRCQKTTRFSNRFWKGSGLVLEGFLRFFKRQIRANCKSIFLAKTWKISIFI